MRCMLMLCTLLLPVGAQAQEIGLYREIIGNARMELWLFADPLVPRNDSDSALGPSEGEWSDIASATVTDSAPPPQAGGFGSGLQLSDLTLSEGVWTTGGDGSAFADVSISYFDGLHGTVRSDGFSLFSATIVVEQPVVAHLDAEIRATLEALTGDVSPFYRASMSVCRVGGTCQVDLTGTDNVVDLTTEKLGYNGPLYFQAPGTYQLRFRAEAHAVASKPVPILEGSAQWLGSLTVREPDSTRLALAALLALGAMRRSRSKAPRSAPR